MTSRNGEFFFVKPGKAFSWDKRGKTWNRIREVASLEDRIDRIVTSPCGGCSLQLPKVTPLLAYHKNAPSAVVITLPLPKHPKSADAQGPPTLEAVAPSGDAILLTQPHSTVDDIPFQFKMQKQPEDAFNRHVKGFACSEDGQAMALAIDDQFWIWRQYPEQTLGIGIWKDLTADQRFVINANSNHPATQEGKICHGYNRLRQSFTLHPALAPNIPQNAAVSYQDLCMFNNPDEGVGVCCLTVLLPPCKPFDTLYMFVSVCTFKGFTPVFERSGITLPIVDGYGAPCIWWSVDCRFAVIAVSQSLVIVTRYLRIIRILPLTKVFPGDQPVVASVAWNCSGEFFVATSVQGDISAVTRSGKSLRHAICHLTPFTSKQVPITVAADSKDPSLFVVYSQKEMRPLKIDVDTVPMNLQILISLQFPQKSVAHLYDRAVSAIREHGVGDPLKIVTLLYFTDMFRIWPYYSPLRYILFTMFNEGANQALENGQDLFAFFLIRCIFRLTGMDVEAYATILERLAWSSTKRDKILQKILVDELNKEDYVTEIPPKNSRIIFYDPTEEDRAQMLEMKPPPHGRDLDLAALVKVVKGLLWDPDFNDREMRAFRGDMRLLLEFLIQLGLFDRALTVSRHYSVAVDPTVLFAKMAATHANDAAKLYQAMTTCIGASPEDELELRAACVKSIVNILRQKISESMPSAEHPQIQMISKLSPLEEEGVTLVTPETPDQLDDFAVVLGIGFCAADYPACANFFNGRQAATPDILRDGVRSLFSMLWFVKWRYAAICETTRFGNANDATVRLLAFPEFVDRNAARAQIDSLPRANFSPDVLAHYIDGTGLFEKDPAFPDFAVECSQGIKPRTLSRIASAVLRFGLDGNDVPKSGILLASLVSHMVPWLRCGIPRALAGFQCDDEIPPELLDFEDFALPQIPPPKMEVARPEYDDDNWQPEPEPAQEAPSESTLPEVPVKKVRSRVKRERKPSPPRRPQPQAPLRLLTVDPTSVAPHPIPPPPPPPPPMPPQMPMYYQPYPIQYPTYQVPPPAPQMFAPIWDFNPSDFFKPGEPEHDEPQEEPQRATQSSQADEAPQKPPKPLVVFASVNERDRFSDTLEMSSSLSDLELQEPPRRGIQIANPFPLDDGLQDRVHEILAEAHKVPDAPKLPDRPVFKAPPNYEIPVINTSAKLRDDPLPPRLFEATTFVPQPQEWHLQDTRPPVKPDISVAPAGTNISIPQTPAGFPNWRPSVVSVRDSKVVGVQGLTNDQFRGIAPAPGGGLPTRARVQLPDPRTFEDDLSD